jgi:hypothetical protein
MSIKQFKDIEQFIKNEAEGYEPPFEEEAWKKMEVLLDKDRDRKKPFFWFWWLLPVLIVGSVGGYLIFNAKPGKNKTHENIVAGKNERSVLPGQPQDKVFITGTGKASPVAIGPGTPVKISTATDIHSARDQQFPPGIKSKVSKNILQSSPVAYKENVLVNSSKVSDTINSKMKLKVSSNIASGDPGQPVNENDRMNNKAGEEKQIKHIPAEAQQTKKGDPLDSIDNLEKITGPENIAAPKQKISKTSSSRFYFIAAAGAEGSGVKLLSAHTISATGGLTIGYQLNKNLSIQTGFFAGSKKYIAGPGDYNPKAGTYWSTVNITRVSANCMVYEVPLNVRYDFTPAKRLKIFASTGLSSYIMKKEGYHYAYNSYGYAHFGQADYTGNQHLFSVLKLAGGIEKNIARNFSLHAAPAVSIPLAGVGEGQVKLYSTELLVGIRYQPSKKIKNK